MKMKTFPDSVQPGIPRLDPPKSGEKRVRIGDLFEKVERPVKIRDDETYRLITVRRSRGGLTLREEMLGRQIAVKSQYSVKNGDFLISKRQIVHGACGFVPPELEGAIVSNEYSVLRCKDALLPSYLSQLTHSIYLQQTFFHSSIGVHIEKMIFKLDEWFKWPLNLPSIDIQKETAEFLGAVDQKISQLTQKKALLADYKRGVMQNLFSQELRFKDDQGHDFPDWEDIPFAQIAKRVSEKFDPKEDDDRPVLIELENISSGTGQIFGHADLAAQKSLKSRFEAGDVLFGKLRPYLRKFARPKFPGVCSSEIWVLRGLAVSNEFLFQMVQGEQFNQLANMSSGSKMPRADWKVIADSEFSIPLKAEQRKISSFLSAIDGQIARTGSEIEEAKTFKKGLLQHMFV